MPHSICTAVGSWPHHACVGNALHAVSRGLPLTAYHGICAGCHCVFYRCSQSLLTRAPKQLAYSQAAISQLENSLSCTKAKKAWGILLPYATCADAQMQTLESQAQPRRERTHFSLRVLVTDSSQFRCDAGHREVVMASRAYICSFFFRIWSYCALR